MAVAAALEALQAGASCPICLDYLRDPVTIECGHNFCRSCIQRSWEETQDRLPCPVCRHQCREWHFRSNAQLGKMSEIAKLLHITRSKRKRQEESRLCERHSQVLTLFCEEDLEVLCPLCAQHPAHQGHHVRPTEEAASHHRKRLSSDIASLKKQVAEMEKVKATQDRKPLELREKMETQRQKIFSEFEHLNQILEREQEAVLSRLADQQKEIQQKINTNLASFSDYISTLKSLQREVAEKSVMSEVKLLGDIKSIYKRHEGLKTPALYSFQLRREGCSLPPQYSALQKIKQKFTEDVTLDPETAHPNLLVSEDKKSVTFVKKKQRLHPNPKRFTCDLIVLGSEGFASGRHYWEVQVDDKPEWTVGVCKDSLSRKGKRHLAGQDRRWTIRLWDGDYVAEGSAPVTLQLTEKPRRIGIYLDYELGEISFYSLNERSHLHTFTDKFSEILKPYFCIAKDSKPLTVCAVSDDE
ncbi:putative tripartite motif-containing protein 75 [Choloepus didactylus]|uniref:putative tripartite motif-containing protein 75 n=1 Tax=Choloepus didactylus TaxID=27675 RepID=UPI00189ED05F|nr:putative tripartite motif-containing protein 75 [Choloepus didactylus]